MRRCDFPGCIRPARVPGFGGQFCETPHRTRAEMTREYALALTVERWAAA